MKHALKTAGLTALAGISSFAVAQTYTPNQMDKAANISVLNAQNFGENTYRQNTDKKNRRVEMNYDHKAAAVDVAIIPPLGSQGVPPATPKSRYTSNDAISGILHLMMMGTKVNGELCQGRVPFFDSKQHYNLKLERVGTKRVKFDGRKEDTIHCRAYYEPIAGYDPEDLPSDEEAQTPINVYFKYYEEAGVHIPVRFTYKISGFKAVVKAANIEIG